MHYVEGVGLLIAGFVLGLLFPGFPLRNRFAAANRRRIVETRSGNVKIPVVIYLTETPPPGTPSGRWGKVVWRGRLVFILVGGSLRKIKDWEAEKVGEEELLLDFLRSPGLRRPRGYGKVWVGYSMTPQLEVQLGLKADDLRTLRRVVMTS